MNSEYKEVVPGRARLEFRWPAAPSPELAENSFFGAWHPHNAIGIQPCGTPAGEAQSVVRGRNWLLCSNGSRLHPTPLPLTHTTPDGGTGVAFRGYLLDPELHSYSPDRAIVKYWEGDLSKRHNGVFSTAVVNSDRVLLLTDAFGFGPLYYRSWNGYLLFSTNPRFLAVDGDSPDIIAWRCWIQSGFIPSDRSLTLGVRRVPAGAAIQAKQDGISERAWFDFDSLPVGERSIHDSAFAEVEECFQVSVDRCLQLRAGKPILPLSSGHDSRRILASLVSKEIDFDSLTVRVQQKEFRDLDATFAAAMAADFGFPHKVIELAELDDYVADDIDRRILTDTESGWHTWVLSMVRHMPQAPGLVFDGILGDILGNPGFRMANMYESTKKDLELIVNKCVSDDYDSVLSSAHWPTAAEVREDLRQYLQPFMHKFNMAEFAFILLRQRRNTSLWSQQLMPAGYVVACPYLDLDYMSLLFSFSPREKHGAVFQRQCLHRFWPDFAKYPGNRDIPPSMSSGDPSKIMKRDIDCFKQLCDEIIASGRLEQVMTRLTLRRRLALRLSRLRNDAPASWSWGVHRLLELQARESGRRACWTEV